MAKIVGIGATVFDVLYGIPSYPAEDTKLRATVSKTSGGGPVGTGLVVAAKLGVETAYLGVLADDHGDRFLKEDFERYGVATELLRVQPGCCSFASSLWLCSDTATQPCVFDKGDLPPLQLDAVQKQAVKDAQVLMVDGNELVAAFSAGIEM